MRPTYRPNNGNESPLRHIDWLTVALYFILVFAGVVSI